MWNGEQVALIPAQSGSLAIYLGDDFERRTISGIAVKVLYKYSQ